MKKLIKGYYYFFYKLYKFFENAPSKWLSDWKAGLIIIVLEGAIWLSSLNYYYVWTKDTTVASFGQPANLVVFFLILGINYWAFIQSDKWKHYVKEFDNNSRRQKNVGGIIVWSIILLIIVNLIFSFYMLGQVDWEKYKKA